MKEIRKKNPTPSTTILSFHKHERAHTHTHKQKQVHTKKNSPVAFVRNEEPLPMAMAMPTLMPPFHTWALHVSLCGAFYLRDCNPPRLSSGDQFSAQSRYENMQVYIISSQRGKKNIISLIIYMKEVIIIIILFQQI